MALSIPPTLGTVPRHGTHHPIHPGVSSLGTVPSPWHSPLGVVDGVPEARRVHDGQAQLDPLLLDVHNVLGDLHRLRDAFCGEGHVTRRDTREGGGDTGTCGDRQVSSPTLGAG